MCIRRPLGPGLTPEPATPPTPPSQAWDACRAIVRSLLAHSEVKLYFGAPVKEEFAPGYYQQISRPMDLGTVLGALSMPAAPRCAPLLLPAVGNSWRCCEAASAAGGCF